MKPKASDAEIISQARKIAASELRRCYKDSSILAGLHQFSDCWARDSLFASLGAIAIGDTDIAKSNLLLLAKHQHQNGQIPIRVGDRFIGLKVLHIYIPQKRMPRYTQDKMNSCPTDQNSLYIIVAREILDTPGGKAFVSKLIPSLEKAIVWNLAQDIDNDSLMEEGKYSTWADSIAKEGKVLYTNVLHCRALECMGEIANRLGKSQETKHYFDLHDAVKVKLNTSFWNGRYYIDWRDQARHDNFSTEGNLLAILWDIADLKQALAIQACMEDYGLNAGVPSMTNHPKYPASEVSIFEHIALISDYHNEGMSWLWLGCVDALCKAKLGLRQDAQGLLSRIAAIIVKYNGVYEVYEQDGNPVRRLVYRAEQPFAWSSGLFLYAAGIVSQISKKTRYIR